MRLLKLQESYKKNYLKEDMSCGCR